MPPADLKLPDCQVLVIDDSRIARQVCETLLHDLGVRRITSVGRMSEARRAVERERYDLVLCDYHFDGDDSNGQDLLEDWRRNRVLSFMTVFIMITGESKYQHVAEAIETALDDYLLKPFTGNTLAERVAMAYRRRLALAPVYHAIEQRDYARAANQCCAVVEGDGPYRMYAARLCVELLIRAGRHADARRLLEELNRGQILPWARLALIALDADEDDLARSRRALEGVVTDHPDFADARDQLARVQFELGDVTGALASMKRAVELTPSNPARLQKLGWLAFLLGDTELAREKLARAWRAGRQSRSFDPHTLLLHMLLLFEAGELRELRRLREPWQRLLRRCGDSPRLARMDRLVEVLTCFAGGQFEAGTARLGELADCLRQPDADFEFACDFLALLVRVSAPGIELPRAARWVELIGYRYSSSRASTAALGLLVARDETLVQLLRTAHGVVTRRCQDAMACLVKGSPQTSVEMLFDCGRRTHNLKPLDMARRVAARHMAELPALAELDAAIARFRERNCAATPRSDLGLPTVTRKIVAGAVLDD
ncbi:response regulator [Derxia lacustris]|uniref:response regulator n=1 Tax=Derxia lacustris TaxID=764842 RepID=UPI000A172C8B|nr:response regulator [Derxia lacustris]